ncbi:hypothetical protein P8C59_005870 [Phyllachora maydis]|nr:hypothetical protein P8C59_005870 [Phyllachora maydis]
MLCVIGGIIAIVVGAFTSWHLYLAAHGQTTIECLEKTRYLSPLRKTMQQAYDATHRAVTSARSQQSSNSEEEEEGGGLQLPKYGQQLLELHQNALPGITRPEEGEVLLDGDTPVPYRDEDADAGAGTLETQAGSRRLTYKELEQYRSRKRYEEYLDEQDSQKLPHAFDLGWRRNLAHLLGPSLWLWALPVCNTTGDGWTWEPSPRWLAARERLARERAQQRERERIAGWGPEDTPVGAGAGRHYLQAGMVSRQSHQPPTTRSAPSPTVGPTPPSKADRVLGRDPTMYVDEPPRQQHENVSLQRLSPAGQSLGQYGEESDDDADDDDDDNNNEELDHTGLFGRAGADPESRDLVRKQQMAAEQRALHVVTNGALGRGGALMRSAVPGPLRSPSTAGQDGRYDDDGVD